MRSLIPRQCRKCRRRFSKEKGCIRDEWDQDAWHDGSFAAGIEKIGFNYGGHRKSHRAAGRMDFFLKDELWTDDIVSDGESSDDPCLPMHYDPEGLGLGSKKLAIKATPNEV